MAETITSAMKKGSKGFGIGGLAMGGFMAITAYQDYRSRVNEGESRGSAAVKVVAENALWAMPGGAAIMTAKMVGDVLPAMSGAIGSAGRNQAARQSRAYKANFGGNFQDSQNAYTMRQRGVQAIQNNQMNVRSVLGSEARTFHRYNVNG